MLPPHQSCFIPTDSNGASETTILLFVAMVSNSPIVEYIPASMSLRLHSVANTYRIDIIPKFVAAACPEVAI